MWDSRGAGLAAGVMIDGCSSSSSVNAQGPSEADVLNFALNLEYLEAEFYSMAVTGARLSSSVTGNTGASPVTGGQQTAFVRPSFTYDAAYEIYLDEVAHVQYLRTALGSAAVAEPSIDLSAGGTFNFATVNAFLTLSRAFEDTGVSAYAGAATLLSGNNLQAAAQILGTEAYHASNIRLLLIQAAVTVPALDSQDVPPADTPSATGTPTGHFFATGANALAIKRTPSQVLAIVYGNATTGTNKGGFFPNGVNGSNTTLKTV